MAPRNARQGISPAHGVPDAAWGGRHTSGDIDLLSRIDAVGVGNAVRVHDGPHTGSVPPGDARQRVSSADGVPEPAPRGRRSARDGESLAGIDAVGIGDAVGNRDGVNRRPIAQGDVRKGLSPLDDVD